VATPKQEVSLEYRIRALIAEALALAEQQPLPSRQRVACHDAAEHLRRAAGSIRSVSVVTAADELF